MSTTTEHMATTPKPRADVARSVPPWLEGTALKKQAREFNKLTERYREARNAHTRHTAKGARESAERADRDAHAQAVRAGKADPGPVNVGTWQAEEDQLRRDAQGAADALTLAWDDLVAAVADEQVGGKVHPALTEERDAVRAELVAAVDTVAELVGRLDHADAHADWITRARAYASRGHGETGKRWPTSSNGTPQPVLIEGRRPLVSRVLDALAKYRVE